MSIDPTLNKPKIPFWRKPWFSWIGVPAIVLTAVLVAFLLRDDKYMEPYKAGSFGDYSPYINAFYESRNDAWPPGYCAQVIVDLGAVRNMTRTIPNCVSARVYMGRDGDSRRVILWPAKSDYSKIESLATVKIHLDQNDCPDYCDFTHLLEGNPIRQSTNLAARNIQSSTANGYIDALVRSEHDPVSHFHIHKLVLKALAAHKYARFYHADSFGHRRLVVVPVNDRGVSTHTPVWIQQAED